MKLSDEILSEIRSHTFDASRYQEIKTIDLHTCGEPLRVITSGIPAFESISILGKRRELMEQYDWIRKLLMFEPRGHADMYGCLLTEPERPDSDFGIIFMHNEGYSTMCGHAIIGITKLIHEVFPVQGRSEFSRELRIDTPCGQVVSNFDATANTEFNVSFTGVPSFVLRSNQQLHLPEHGNIRYNLAYGGAFYAYVDSAEFGLALNQDNVQEIRRLGMLIKKSIIATKAPINHPFEEDLSFLYGVIFENREQPDPVFAKNVCVFANGEIDRSPTGSGVCGNLAILHQQKTIGPREAIIFQSIVESRFRGRVKEETTFGNIPAVIPQVEGTAFITGSHTFVLDADDRLGAGFLVR